MAIKEVSIEASVAGLYTSIRGFKYSFHEAVADIVDNCVDADAGLVEIVAERGNSLLIIDDGKGMNDDDLTSAITPWGNAGDKLKEKQHKKGKYGIGLKSAGFSLGDIICVHTKKRGGTFCSAELDLNELKKNKTTKMKININSETDTWKKCGLKYGTIVEIRKVNERKITQNAIDSLKSSLGVSFYGMLENKELLITINKTPVEPLNPLIPGLKKNSQNNHYHAFRTKTIKLKNEEGKVASFKLSAAYIGRGFNWSEKEKKENRWWISSKIKNKVKIDDQGLYIMRNGRLITHGGWQKTRPFSHHHSPLRVLLEYLTEGDSLVGVDHTKTKPELEQHFIDIINAKYLDEIFNESEELFRKEGMEIGKKKQKEIADKQQKERTLPKPSSVDSMIDKDEKRRKHYPEYEAQQMDLDEAISEGLVDEWIKFVDRLPYDNMWQPKMNKDEEPTCVFSDSHPGYAALYFEDDPDKVRRNLDTFFLLLSTYELEFSELSKKLQPKVKEELKKQFEALRRYISKHFRDFD